MRLRVLALASVVAFLGAACTTAPPGEPGPTSPTPAPAVALVKIAYFEDLSPEGATAWTAPAFQGARLAIDTAGLADPLPVAVELVAFDTKGSSEDAAAVASEVAADPAYVAGIGAPFLTGQLALGRILDPAGVPMITLSTLGPKLARSGWTTWRRAVANEQEQGDGIKDETFLSVAGGSGVGMVATCPCADLSASTELRAQRFIQDYQADFGLPPGPYSAEALDVTRMILRAIREGATTRGGVLAALATSDPFEGLANTYAFRSDGELAPEAAHVRLCRDEGGRWIPLPGL